MTLATLVTNAGEIVGAVGDTFGTLSEDFGFVLFIPVTFAFAKTAVGMVKSIMFFRRGRSRR